MPGNFFQSSKLVKLLKFFCMFFCLSDKFVAMFLGLGSCSYYTCSKKMPGSLGHEEQDAKTFASWVCVLSNIYEN